VVKARSQLDELSPLLVECDTYDALGEEIAALEAERRALPYFFAQHRAGLLTDRITARDRDVVAREREKQDREVAVAALAERRQALLLERAGHGGDRIGELERQIGEAEQLRDQRRTRADRFNELLRLAELPAVERAEQFDARLAEVAAAAGQVAQAETALRERAYQIAVNRNEVQRESDELNTELVSLRSRRSSIPATSLALRRRLCDQAGVPEQQLPFAGELIQVRPEHAQWEGAAERMLRGFGLSLLVPDEHYRTVSEWINDNHLGSRLVYYRVPPTVTPGPAPGIGENATLASKLEIADTELYPWLERELAHRAGYECVETMDQFRRASRAVTRAGQIKGAGGRHEKDDRRRIDDRSTYVLGWSNQQKIDSLLARAAKVQQRLNELDDERKRADQQRARTDERRAVLAKLTEFRHYPELDWHAMVARAENLRAEKARIEAASTELDRLGREIATVENQLTEENQARDCLLQTISQLEYQQRRDRDDLARTQELLAGPAYEAAAETLGRLAERIDTAALTDPDGMERLLNEVTSSVTTSIARTTSRQSAAGNRAVQKMAALRQRYPLETAELDDAVQAAGEYRALHRRLLDDDLPRFEAQFKTYLNTNTIRDIAGFLAQLNKQLDLIRERIATINGSLVAINYNPGRYIRLEQHPSPNTDIRDFRTELRACTESTVSGDDSDQYSEQKFLQVKAIIERLRGREGQTEVDRAWTRRVTDVRNWFVFSASERWREDDREHENYTDSGGKSGGQKEKLAYTILAASLAYQFKLDWDAERSRSFRFVVIDEAFGRGSDESTRFALRLFSRLGLQLLIVTPLQKIHVIEPYVSSVGLVDNTAEGDCSRLHGMTIEEYRERRLAHAVAQAATPA
jgi:uncharacterized protein YPO0396